MKHKRLWLTAMAVLLCSVAQINAATVNLGGWTSTNHGSGTVSEEYFSFTIIQGGSLSFDWAVSSEANFDFLTVYLDGTEILNRSGEQSGSYTNENLIAGDHTLTVRYSKDGSQNDGSDQGVISNIVVIDNVDVTYLMNWTSTNHEHSSTSEETYSFYVLEGGYLSFNWTISSESGCDRLVVILDGSEVVNQSGEYSGTYTSDRLSAGMHTMIVRYTKDGSVSNGLDQATISNVAVYGMTEMQTLQDWTSTNHEDGSVSSETYTFETSAGAALYFDWYVSSESGCDFLTVTLDGTQIVRQSGNSYSGNYSNTNLSEGEHILVVQYSKDGSVNNGSDLASVTNISVAGMSTVLGTVSVDGLTYEIRRNGTAIVCALEDSTMTEVVIPNVVTVEEAEFVVTAVKERAFEYNNHITMVTIPETVTSIGHFAFYRCYSLVTVDIMGALNRLGDYAFQYCTSLENLTIAEGLTHVGKAAISHCTMLKDFTLPNSVQTIGEYAFDYTGFENVTLPENVISIGNYAFRNCSNLAAISLPASVTSIGRQAFEGCTGELSFECNIPATSADSCGVFFASRFTKVTIGANVSSIGQQAFDSCAVLKEVVIADGGNTLWMGYNGSNQGLFFDCPLETLYLGRNLDYNTDSYYGYSPFYNKDMLVSVSIGDNVTTIGNYAFRGCTALTSIFIPNSVTQVGSFAFDDCTALTEVVIADGGNTLWMEYNGSNQGLFFDCPLKTLYLGRNLDYNTDSYYGYSPFYNKDMLASVVIGDSVTAIGYREFYDCDTLTAITIPGNVTTIGNYAFRSCDNLASVTLEEGVTTIGYYAFNETAWQTIELPASITSIGDWAFPNSATRLTCNATTPPSIDYDLGNIAIVYVPTGCKAAYKGVYPWSSKVVVDGSGVTVDVTVTPGLMGEEILTQANYLSDVNYLTIRGAINETDINNIKNSMPNLLTIDMSGLDMKHIPNDMFFDRKALLSVVFPNNVESIGSYSFYNCINLESLVLPEGLKRIEDGSYSMSINGAYKYYVGSFSGCSSLTSVIFPSTLESIGDFAFCNCSHLRNIEFKEGLSDIRRWAFADCLLLSDFVLPNSLRNISAGAFKGCYSLREVVIPDGVVSIGYSYEDDYIDWHNQGAFENCSSLAVVELPSGLERICQRTFYNCGNLNHVVIPEGVAYIGRHAFYDCTSLVEVILPSTLNSTGSTPFAGCNQLSSVSCLALLPPTLADGLLTLQDMGLPIHRTLYVPEWTMNRYKLSSGWAAFSEILPIVGVYPSTINILGDAILTLPAAGLPTGYKPDMYVLPWYDGMSAYAYSTASLEMRGGGEINLNKFTFETPIEQYAGRSQLLNNVDMASDSVVAVLHMSNYNYDYYNSSTWHFLSFPFDVKISDITTETDWVVRKYDGQARAEGNYNNTWVTVPYDSVLYAGQGYIWSCTGGQLTVPAMDNANKNLMFAKTTRAVALQEYAAETTANSSWNLVGNPFPSYYDTHYMDYAAPITVWDTNNNTYAAYSPVDDDYVLQPFEAFFVQCPVDVDSIKFDPDGRQLIGTSQNVPTAPAMNRSVASSRQVINLVLSNGQGFDRTRIVVNEAAKMDYEISCDAAKFMSNNADMPQLFSMVNGEKLAINERPMGNGVVKLGTHFSAAGTYTIAMQNACDMAVVLVDLKNGVETDLTTGEYTFTAGAGDNARFEVRMFADEITAVESTIVGTKVVAEGDAIVVTAVANADVQLYNAAGRLVATGQGANLTFNVAQGVYVVKVNGVSHKVAVVK